MADQYTPEEIQSIFEAYNNAVKSGTPISEDLAKAMKDATKGMKGYADQQSKLMSQMGKSTADFTKAMYQGKQGMTAMNGAVDAVGSGLEILINLIPGARLLKMGLTLLTKAVGAAIKVTNEQSDALFKTYQDLAKTGAGAAGGMRDVFDNMQKFGYGLDQLDQMTNLIKENSKTLSSFGGTVLGGTKVFANSMAEIQRSDVGRQFQRMGHTVDDINKYGAGYIKMQQMLGQSQSSIQKNLTDGTTKYAMELDKLARITGDTREAQEAKIQEAMAEDTFAATMDELREQAAAGDASAEARMKKLNILNQTLTGEARQEFIKAIGGDVAAAQKLMMTAPQAYQMMLDSTSSAGDVMRTMTAEEKNFRSAYRGLYKLGAMGDVGFKFAEGQERAAKFGEKYLDQQLSDAEIEQTLTDQTTKNAADIRISEQQARDALQSFVNIGVSPATTALKGLAGAAAGVSRIIPGNVAGGSTSQGQSMGGGGATGNDWWKQLFGGGGGGGGTNQILETIKRRESGGNYQAQAKGSSASGAYQFIDKTWQGLTKKYGMGTEFKSAKMAPKEIQDAIAGKYVEELLGQAGGDVSKVPLAWYTGNIQGKISPEAIAANNGLTPEMYQRKWMADYAKSGGVSGPSSGYDNKMASVKPDTTLPSKEASTAQSSPGTSGDDVLQAFNSKLDALVRASEDTRDNTKKSAQYAGA